ncbi:MAG TPA: lycopene cyclase domain-containing protein [Ktedonobacteraceae bacterium]
MTYALFLCFFLVFPIIVLSLLLRRHLLEKRYWLTTGLLFIPVLLCMAPWDHVAVSNGIWNWTPQQTWGLRFWLIPPEEYLFALLQTILATMLVYGIGLWWRDR